MRWANPRVHIMSTQGKVSEVSLAYDGGIPMSAHKMPRGSGLGSRTTSDGRRNRRPIADGRRSAHSCMH